jgi:hypothetical protein
MIGFAGGDHHRILWIASIYGKDDDIDDDDDDKRHMSLLLLYLKDDDAIDIVR